MLHFRVDRKMVTEIAAFGDLLVHSDFLSCALSTSDSPVVLLESQEELSASFEMFWFKFLNSEYDICG